MTTLKNHNTTFLIIMGIGLLVALVSFIAVPEYELLETNCTYVGFSIAHVGGLFMLIANGTFILTKYYRVLKLLFAVCLAGVLCILMRWPYADLILSIGFSGIILNYFFSFLAKPKKALLDYLKLIWVISSFGYAILKFFHLIKEEYQLIGNIVLWLAIMEYLRLEYKKGRLRM